MEQRKDSRISQSMRKKEQNIKNETEKSSRIRRSASKGCQDQGVKRMEQRKDSRISRLMQKKTKN